MRIQAEEEERRAEDQARAQRDREERARVRALADEAPKLQKQVIRLEEELKDLKSDYDELRVQLAKQEAAMAMQRAKGPQAKRNDGWGADEMQGLRESIERVSNKPVKGGRDEDPHAEWGGVEAADVELRLERDIAEIPEGSAEREEFKRLFIDDIAKALGIPRELIHVTGFEEGSIIVKFTIMPDINSEDDNSDTASPMELARRLQQQLAMDRSPLKDGIVTGTVVAVDSRPSSAASSRQHSARHPPGDHGHNKRGGAGYNAGAAQAAAENKSPEQVSHLATCMLLCCTLIFKTIDLHTKHMST